MTSFTPNVALPYPDGTDAPCDGAAQLNDLKNTLFDLLDGYEQAVDRQKDFPMVSIARLGIQGEVSGRTSNKDGTPIVFDTVEHDDLRAANLVADSQSITLGVPANGSAGEFLLGFTVQIPDTEPPGVIGTHFRMDLIVNGVRSEILDSDQNAVDDEINSYKTASGLISFPGPLATVQVAPGSNQVSAVWFARLWALRVGDA